ncbi:Modification methylase DpnIIB [compost metagenome]
MNARLKIYQGDCLKIMPEIQPSSVDMILCDLPYGTTACKWDEIISFEALWENYYRILKPRGAIVLTSSQPFTTVMIASNMKRYCYNWVWDKKFGANFAQAKRQPLKTHEDICVFSHDGKMPTYNPQMIKRDVPIKLGKNKGMTSAIPLVTNESYDGKIYDEKYPDSQLHYSCREERGLHPTQKPVSLMEYLIETYTSEGDTVLDNCMGSGTTGVACVKTNRKFIGIEKDVNYYSLAQERILGQYEEMLQAS